MNFLFDDQHFPSLQPMFKYIKSLMLPILFRAIELFYFSITAGAVIAQEQQVTGMLVLKFHSMAGQEQLVFDKEYTNALGEIFSVSKFRYYVSNISLGNEENSRMFSEVDGYYLVNEKLPESKEIILRVPPGKYDRIQFLLGVDSLKNVSGAQTGALDPLNDMFWTWQSGYVMAKLEGKSLVSKLPHQMFEYHIGGFKGKHSVLQQVILPLGDPLHVTSGKTFVINIVADLNLWFQGEYSLPIAAAPLCTSEGELALKYSKNYSRMFAIDKIISQ